MGCCFENVIMGIMLVTLGYQGMAPDEAGDREPGAFIVDFDNDVLAPGGLDEAYTYGVSITESGGRAKDRYLLPGLKSESNLHRILSHIDGRPDGRDPYFRIGITGFTPPSRTVLVPSDNSRPFSSIFYVQVGHTVDRPGHERASSLTLGIIGTDVAKFWQDGLHDDYRLSKFEGWDSQISDGGEFTALYTQAWAKRLLGNPDGAGAIYGRFSYMLGFQTDLGAELTFISGPRAPDRVSNVPGSSNDFRPFVTAFDKSRADASTAGDAGRKRMTLDYVFGGISARAVVYNALLQGQFRSNAYEIRSDDVERYVPGANVGIAFRVFGNQFQYVVAYKGREIKNAPRDERSHYWGRISYRREL